MGGLARICKIYGSMVINGQRMVWDYVADKAVPESEMPEGSARWRASEAERWFGNNKPRTERPVGTKRNSSDLR